MQGDLLRRANKSNFLELPRLTSTRRVSYYQSGIKHVKYHQNKYSSRLAARSAVTCSFMAGVDNSSYSIHHHGGPNRVITGPAGGTG